ncbi:ABC transporter permease, partial [Parabacteroides distasonis]
MNTQVLKMALGGTLLMDLGRMLLRVIITLVLTGAYMHYLFEINNVWLNIAWLLIVTAAAALTTLREARIGGLKLWLPLTAGMGAGIVVAGLLFLACAGLLRQLPDARCIVPVAGLLIATMTVTCMKGMGSYHRSLAEDISKYNFLIGNGATHGEAIAPFVRKALESGLCPMTEGTAIMQLVTMPAMMGMILGGYPPVTAMKCQLLILIAAILSSVVAICLTIWLADNILFDNFGRRRNIKAMGLGVALMLTVVALTACNSNTAHRPLIGGDVSKTEALDTEQKSGQKGTTG